MDITNPDHIIVRKSIKRNIIHNTQFSIEKSWLDDAGYKTDDNIPVFLHAPTNAIMLFPKETAASVIKAKKKNSTKIEKRLASA
jgi:hypothetical protein